jgi:hypothetical protein
MKSLKKIGIVAGLLGTVAVAAKGVHRAMGDNGCCSEGGCCEGGRCCKKESCCDGAATGCCRPGSTDEASDQE